MSPLLTQQAYFAQCISWFIIHAAEQGYNVTLGEAYRPPEMAEIYFKEGKGIKDSVHCLRMAMDLNFFDKNGFLVTTPEPLAVLWEANSNEHYAFKAGLFFKPVPDADHFSIEWNGIA